MTDASGKYKITGVLPAKIILEAAICYKPKGRMLTVSANNARSLLNNRNDGRAARRD